MAAAAAAAAAADPLAWPASAWCAAYVSTPCCHEAAVFSLSCPRKCRGALARVGRNRTMAIGRRRTLTKRASQNRGTSDIERPPQRLPRLSQPTGSSASKMVRRRAPEAAGRVAVAAVAVVETAVGSRNSRRNRCFRPRGTSSPRANTTASVRQKKAWRLLDGTPSGATSTKNGGGSP